MQGTAPFIAIELLIHGTSHRVVHDLESVLYVLLFSCSHFQGPYNDVRDPPLYGGINSIDHPFHIKEWLSATNLSALGHIKFSHMMGHFESHILPYISPYFSPLKKHLIGFRNALLPRVFTLDHTVQPLHTAQEAVHSLAICRNVINVLKNALLDKALIDEAKQGCSVLGKHSIPGDLVITPNGWDAIKVPKTVLSAKPKLSLTPA
jgi:hypothetical protein